MEYLISKEIIIGLFIGGFITWVVARFYYAKTSKELLKETNELRKLLKITISVLEAGGIYQVSRNEKGEIKGLIHQASGNVLIQATALGVAEIKSADT